jgi:hypothetical protein
MELISNFEKGRVFRYRSVDIGTMKVMDWLEKQDNIVGIEQITLVPIPGNQMVRLLTCLVCDTPLPRDYEPYINTT